jgi:glycosyltransferase involved in cell wall biosynthesis
VSDSCVSGGIDVLLPVYALANRSQLQRSIASVYEQKYPAKNLWVLINGGQEFDRQQLAAFVDSQDRPSHSTVLHAVCLEEIGITVALNRGLALSQAEWLARLDTDDRMVPERLQSMVDYLRRCLEAQKPLPDVIGSAVAVLDAQGERATGQILYRPCTDQGIRRYLCRGNPFMHPSVMIRRSLLLEVGGYRPIPQAEDLDLWLRLSRIEGVQFTNLRQPLTLYTLSQGSESHQRNSFLYSALCRLRHCDSPSRTLLFTPKIMADLLRYFQRLLLWR